MHAPRGLVPLALGILVGLALGTQPAHAQG